MINMSCFFTLDLSKAQITNMLIFRRTTLIIPISVCCYLELRNAINFLTRVYNFTKQSDLCSIMSEQPMKLLLIKLELPSETILHCVNLNCNTH